MSHRYMVESAGRVSIKYATILFHNKESEKVAAKHLQRTENNCNHYTDNNRSKHKTFTRPYFFRAVLAEHKRNDNPGKNHNPYQQKGKYTLAELLTTHPFDAEIKLWRKF